MASLNEIANDLQAQHDLINKRGFNVCSMQKSIIRARDALRSAASDLQDRDCTISALEDKISVPEASAEDEARRFEAYRNGNDLHGN